MCSVSNMMLEARAGIEPAIKLLQSPALPLGYPASQLTHILGWELAHSSFFNKILDQKKSGQNPLPQTKHIVRLHPHPLNATRGPPNEDH